MSKFCKTRVNDVARAQAVTELQALADDASECTTRNHFPSELQVYTERIEVCAC